MAAAVLGIPTLFITQVVTGAITRAAGGSFFGAVPTIEGAYRFGFIRLWSLLLVAVLVALAVTAGFILMVIPGFVVMTRLASSVPVLVVEGRRGRQALRRSWNLTKGNGWHVFGTLFVAVLLMGIASGILTSPFDQSWLGRGVGAAIGSVITVPYAALVVMLVYLDLRARNEGPEVETVRREFEAAGVGSS